MPAVLHVLRGEATLTPGEDAVEVGPNAWVHMSAGLRHAVRVKAPTVMLLLLIKETK